MLDGSVIVAIERCGIGGPDLETFRTGSMPAPAWFGHEWAGRIVAVGRGCEDRFEGERVVGAVPPPCGQCRNCRAGLSATCEVALAMIVGADPLASNHGAFAERIRVDSRRAHRIPEGIDDSDAALAEPAAVAAHAVRRGAQGIGDMVVVVGAGTVGVLVAELARLAGATRVVGVDVDPDRRELACQLGADAAFAPGPEVGRWLAGHGHGLGADVVYECSGGGNAMSTAIAAVRQGGTLTIVSPAETAGTLSASELVAKEITVHASLGYNIADVHRALELMADDRFRVSALYDQVIGFSEMPAMLAALSGGQGPTRKVLFSPSA